MALLVLAAAAGCRVTAVHVDHCLRPDSAREARESFSISTRVTQVIRHSKEQLFRKYRKQPEYRQANGHWVTNR